MTDQALCKDLNETMAIGNAIEVIADRTDTDIPDVINALTGIAFDEEDAGKLKRYHQEWTEG